MNHSMQPLQHSNARLQQELLLELYHAASLSSGRDSNLLEAPLSVDTTAASTASSLGLVPRDALWAANPVTTFATDEGGRTLTSLDAGGNPLNAATLLSANVLGSTPGSVELSDSSLGLRTTDATSSVHSASTGSQGISLSAEEQRLVDLRTIQLLSQIQMNQQTTGSLAGIGQTPEQLALNAYDSSQQDNEMIQRLLIESQIQELQQLQQQNLLFEQAILRRAGRELPFLGAPLTNAGALLGDDSSWRASLTAATMPRDSSAAPVPVGLNYSDVAVSDIRQSNMLAPSSLLVSDARPAIATEAAAPLGAVAAALPSATPNESEAATPTGTTASIAQTSGAAEPPRPKKWLTAYNLFFKDERVKLMKEIEADNSAEHNKGSASKKKKIGFEEMARIIGKRWKEVDPQRREQYQYQAAQGKKQFEHQVEEFKKRKCDILEAKRQQQEATVSESTRNRYFETARAEQKSRSGSSRQNKKRKSR